MRKILPDEYIDCEWKAKNIIIKGANENNAPKKEIFKIAKRVLDRVLEDEDLTLNAKNNKLGLFHLECDLEDGSHISIPLVVGKGKEEDKWYYLTPDYLMKDIEK